jgi:transposase
MYPRINTVKQGGKTYHYLQILQSFRQEGKIRQRLVANLGRMDLLGANLDRLVAALSRYCKEKLVSTGQLQCKDSVSWGPVLLARYLWHQMGLSQIVAKYCQSPRHKFDVAETAFVLVANRLCQPSSEHGLARWLEHTFVCDSQGQRWQPDWLPAEAVSKKQRVKVQHSQLNQWYRTLDALLAAKDNIEQALYHRVRDLFNLKVDMVFYDLTSSYFCRKQPIGRLRRHGHSKDKRPRQVQVVLGVVMANGFPIAHHVFAGNTADESTLQQVLSDLQERFGIRHIMLVSDRGLVSPENLQFLSEHKFSYLLGIGSRRSQEAEQVLARLDEQRWQQVDEGNQVQEIALDDKRARYFVIDSSERKDYEQSMRLRSMQRAREQLQKVASAVKAARLKEPAKIGAAASKAASSNHGYRYYCWKVAGSGQFDFFEDQDKLRAEITREGKYILKTDNPDITAVEAVACYKELNTVEQGFRDLKDVIDMRPIYHKSDERIEAHIFVASLALFLKRTLEYQLSCKLPEISATDALSAMKSIGIAELNFAGQSKRLVSVGGRDARRIVSALGIKAIEPLGVEKTAVEEPKSADVVTN